MDGNTNNFVIIDDLNKIRILDPEISEKSDQLRTEGSDFIEYVNNFQQIVDGFLSMIESLAEAVGKEKMRAIGISNIVNSMSKERENEQIQLQTMLMEKAMELERLKIQYQSLLKVEQEQQDYIDLLLSSR